MVAVPGRGRAARLVAGLLAAGLLVAGCTGEDADPPTAAPPTGRSTGSAAPAGPSSASPAVPADLRPFYEQELRWVTCGGRFECATLRVPLDYDDPGQDIEVAVLRVPATGPGERIGSLLLNPGGPGGSGLDYARAARVATSPEVRARFDVVGFDPRGVGESTPVDCLSDEQLDELLALDGSPDDPVEEQAVLAAGRDVAAGCAERSGELLPHIGTADVARDMDVLRAALGEDSLHYLGKSYGTYLGAVYAELFPDRVGRLVLDGAVDPAADAEEAALAQAAGFDAALQAFVEDCLQREDCPLEGPADAAREQVGAFLAGIDAEPLPTDGDRRLSESLAVLGLAAALYEERAGWPLLRAALAQALDGDGTGLLTLADLYTQRQDDGSYAGNVNEVITAVSCLDSPGQDVTVEQLRALEQRFAEVAPVFGPYLAWGGAACSAWPATADPPVPGIDAAGAGPILVVGTTGDPATPYAWSEALAEQLASGVLLTWEGEGHTAYRRGSACVDAAVDAYLIEGVLPPEGERRCS